MQFAVDYDSEGHVEAINWHHDGPIGFGQLCDGCSLTFDKLVVYLDKEQAKELLIKLQAALGVKCSECQTFKECRPGGSPGNDSKPCDGFVRRPENPPVESAEATARETDGEVDASLFTSIGPGQLVFAKRLKNEKEGPTDDGN